MSAKPIVAATDGSEESLRAVEWAAREAVLRGIPLRVVSAAALLPRMIGSHAMSGYDAVAEHIREDSHRALAMACERAAKAAPDVLIDTDQLTGQPAQAVTESGSGALMLVVGSRGIGAFAAMVLGSVSRYAATHAACPVAVIRDETATAHKRIGVGLGDPEHAGPSLGFAFEEASLRQAGLIVIHAWHAPEYDIPQAGQAPAGPARDVLQAAISRELERLLNGWREKYPDIAVSQEVAHGHPGRALAGLSARTDLVVIGRRSTVPGVHGPGTVTHALLNHAHGPVVTVPSS